MTYRYDTGLPYSAVGSIDIEPYFDTLLPANSRYVAAPSGRTYYFSKRGEFRLDDVTATDLAVNYRYPISRFEIFAQGELLNVFDGDTVTTVNTAVSASDTSANFAPFNPYSDTPKECPQGTAAATCRAGGFNWQKGVNFGNPSSATSYQTPRLWQFSVGLRF